MNQFYKQILDYFTGHRRDASPHQNTLWLLCIAGCDSKNKKKSAYTLVSTALGEVSVAAEDSKGKTFSWDLVDRWEEDLDKYKRMFTQLQVYSNDILEVNLSCTWKSHIIFSHLKTFFQKAGCGRACFTEQTGESVHHFLKPALQNHKRKECYPDHGKRQQNVIAEF